MAPDGRGLRFTMNRNALMVATATRWYGTARMPRSLAKAGFVVSLLAPRGAMAFKSRFIARSVAMHDGATPMQWLLAVAGAVREVAPGLLIPCDEVALRLLFEFVRSPPPAFRGSAGSALRELVQRSLGDPAHYDTSVDKSALPAAALALGVPVPPFAVAQSVAEAAAHAERLGFPVIVKRRFGFASQGVAVVRHPDELADAARGLLQPMQIDLGMPVQPRLLVQSFIDGRTCSQTMVAWEGTCLAGFAREREVAFAQGKGATAVVRLRRNASIRESTERLCRGFGISGFLSVEFIAPAAGGPPLLLEINRRLETMTHLDEFAGVDMCGALYARLAGVPNASPQDMSLAGDGIIATFPREWLRDPDSSWLRDHPCDVPWDDPPLFEALVALRNE